MSLYNIFVVNTAPGCDTTVSQQITTTGCTTYIVKLAPNSNALGPFDIFYSLYPIPLSGATLIASGQTRLQMLAGVPITLDCPTPTPTPTPSTTPTITTPTPTPTFTTTPTNTPTYTNTPTNTPTYTPSFTPTSTVSETPTNTPTPTSTPLIFEIYLITQDGLELIQQDGSRIITQQSPTSYVISSGDSICLYTSYSLIQTVYSSSPDWTTAVSFYTDALLSTPFNGNNLWYSNDSLGCNGMWQIGTDGFVIGFICNPC